MNDDGFGIVVKPLCEAQAGANSGLVGLEGRHEVVRVPVAPMRPDFAAISHGTTQMIFEMVRIRGAPKFPAIVLTCGLFHMIPSKVHMVYLIVRFPQTAAYFPFAVIWYEVPPDFHPYFRSQFE